MYNLGPRNLFYGEAHNNVWIATGPLLLQYPVLPTSSLSHGRKECPHKDLANVPALGQYPEKLEYIHNSKPSVWFPRR